jgi:GTPase
MRAVFAGYAETASEIGACLALGLASGWPRRAFDVTWAAAMPSAPSRKAVLVAVKLPETEDSDFRASLVELERLVNTLGYDVVERITQARESLSPAAVLGEGKLEQLAKLSGGTGETRSKPRTGRAKSERAGARTDDTDDTSDDDDTDDISDDDGTDDDSSKPEIDLIAVDHEISPSQLRNLERATGVSTLDRTGVIIEIFHRHARSREARLEVEIARLKYTAPRLREAPRGKERRAGRGAGESQLELDRRRIRDRISELTDELERAEKERDTRRQRRRDAQRVALVGYTNAGKSSLMRALTASQVLVEDKLFATLDTTVRALHPETRPRILVSDTVGFIRKLPHDLVASFKSTLDEALEASLLLEVVDASDPDFLAQLAVTREVLSEIGAGEVPRRLVLNKVDRLTDDERLELAARFPDAWLVSARRAEDVAWLRSQIIAAFSASYREVTLSIPYARQSLLAKLHESGRVIEQTYTEQGVDVRFESDPETLERLRRELGD